MSGDCRFWLGTHHPSHVGRTDVPLFVSDVRLRDRKTLPRAAGPVAIDSGGFSALSLHGTWSSPAVDYAARVRRYRDEIGNVRWAAIQDWMCEPPILASAAIVEGEFGSAWRDRYLQVKATDRLKWVIEAGPTLTDRHTSARVALHQQRTVNSWIHLNAIAGDVLWAPVLQGFSFEEYLTCAELYERHAATRLRDLPIVGLGSVCRRQDTTMVERLARHFHARGVRLHGFGFKLKGLSRSARYFASADSMAWSFAARRGEPMPGCRHKSCANCLRYALRWRGRALSAIGRGRTTPDDSERLLELR